MNNSFIKAVGVGLMFCGISLFAFGGLGAAFAGAGAKVVAADIGIAAAGTLAGYGIYKSPGWIAAAP